MLALVGAQLGKGRGWSLWVKQFSEDTSADNPLEAQWVTGWVRGSASQGGGGGGLWQLEPPPSVVRAMQRPLLPQGLALVESCRSRAGAPMLGPHSGSRAGSRADAEQVNSCLRGN